MSSFLSDLPTRLKTSLAACHYFKAWPVVAWSGEQAAERIHLVQDTEFLPVEFAQVDLNDKLSHVYPAAIVDALEVKGNFVASPGGYDMTWNIGFALRQFVDMDIGDDLEFEEIVERIIKSDDATKPGLNELRIATPATYLDFGTFEVEGPWFTRPEAKPTQGDIVSYYVTLHSKKSN